MKALYVIPFGHPWYWHGAIQIWQNFVFHLYHDRHVAGPIKILDSPPAHHPIHPDQQCLNPIHDRMPIHQDIQFSWHIAYQHQPDTSHHCLTKYHQHQIVPFSIAFERDSYVVHPFEYKFVVPRLHVGNGLVSSVVQIRIGCHHKLTYSY